MISSLPAGEPSETSGPRSTSSRTRGRSACSTGRVDRHQPNDSTTATMASPAATANQQLARGSWSSLRGTGIFRCRNRIFNLDPHVAGIVEALTPVFLQAAPQENADCLALSRQRGPIRLGSDHGGQNVGNVFAVKCLFSGEQFVEHAAEGPDVRALVHRFARAPARDSCRPPCRESRLASSLPWLSVGELLMSTLDGSPSNAFAKPKSNTLTLPSGVNFHVGGFQIAVNDSFFVRGFESFSDLLRNRRELPRSEPAHRA